MPRGGGGAQSLSTPQGEVLPRCEQERQRDKQERQQETWRWRHAGYCPLASTARQQNQSRGTHEVRAPPTGPGMKPPAPPPPGRPCLPGRSSTAWCPAQGCHRRYTVRVPCCPAQAALLVVPHWWCRTGGAAAHPANLLWDGFGSTRCVGDKATRVQVSGVQAVDIVALAPTGCTCWLSQQVAASTYCTLPSWTHVAQYGTYTHVHASSPSAKSMHVFRTPHALHHLWCQSRLPANIIIHPQNLPPIRKAVPVREAVSTALQGYIQAARLASPPGRSPPAFIAAPLPPLCPTPVAPTAPTPSNSKHHSHP